MHRLDARPARFIALLLTFCFGSVLLGACADILGFEEGKPYPPDSGAADGGSCQNGTCDCPSGTHQCGDTCVLSSDPKTCGTSCSACEPPNGGEATCDGTKCGVSCPTGQKPCAGTCIPMQSACTTQCPAMTHDCGGACASDTSVNACGTTCSPCNVPPSGQATCDGTTCGIQCNPTFKPCGNQCIPATACCTTAECPMNSTCSGNQCQCGNGFKLCQGACIPTGDCCTDGDCRDNAACVGNRCQCKSTFKDCNGACIPNGSCCTSDDCTNGYQCSGNACQCQLPNIVCQGRCLNGATDTNNCGACGHVCPLGCTQSHCACAIADQNVILNPGFDTDLAGWGTPGATATWVADDAVDCPTSGSVRLTTMISQEPSAALYHCFPIAPTSSTYNVGARVRRLPGSATGYAYIAIYFQTGANCSGTTVAFFGGPPTVDIASGPDWTTIATPPITGVTGVTSVDYELHFLKTDQTSASLDVEVDMAYIAPSPSVGWR